MNKEHVLERHKSSNYICKLHKIRTVWLTEIKQLKNYVVK